MAKNSGCGKKKNRSMIGCGLFYYSVGKIFEPEKKFQCDRILGQFKCLVRPNKEQIVVGGGGLGPLLLGHHDIAIISLSLSLCYCYCYRRRTSG